jgi:RNA polymerase sigma-70 factor (ECF subfamily)
MADAQGVLTSLTLLRQLGDPGNERAWWTFLERYQPLIYGWCRRWGLGHTDAEEVSAAVLAKLVELMRTFVYDPRQCFRGWLKTVVHNEVRSRWRQVARRPGDRGSGDPKVHKQLEAVEAPGGVGDLVEELDGTMQRDLRRAQRVTARVRERVQPHTWQAFWLTAIEKESASEVAGKLGMTVAAVYMAKSGVSQKLREEGAKLLGRAEGCQGVVS